jgi:hypothetical protein
LSSSRPEFWEFFAPACGNGLFDAAASDLPSDPVPAFASVRQMHIEMQLKLSNRLNECEIARNSQIFVAKN